MRAVTAGWAMEYYNLGIESSNLDTLREAIRAAIDSGHEIDCWEAAAAFRAGFYKYGFIIKNYERFGAVPVGQDGYAVPSVNHAQGESECGVSVITEDWLNSLTGQVSVAEFAIDGTQKVSVSGLKVGYGSDGEICILPIK